MAHEMHSIIKTWKDKKMYDNFKIEFTKLDSTQRKLVLNAMKFDIITIVDDRDKKKLNTLISWCERNLKTVSL